MKSSSGQNIIRNEVAEVTGETVSAFKMIDDRVFTIAEANNR